MAFGFTGNVVARTTSVYEADIRPLEKGADQAERTVHRSAKAIDRDLRDLDSRWEKLGKSAGLSGKAIGMGLAVAGPLAAAGLYKAVQAASDLDEQLNKTRVVFGDAAKDVIAFSETTATSLGISQRATLEATGTFGNMLVPMGFAREEAAQMSTRMVQLAADMASFNNASPERTLEALRSGLAGETEPLRMFGVFLNDARLKQEALTLGLWNGKGALDANAKAAATYSIILKDTKDAQGDFGRTSESLANQQRIARASLEDLAASVGKALLPAVTAAIGELTEFLTAVLESGEASEIAEGLIDALRSTFDSLEPPARNAARVLQAIAEAVGGWDNAFQIILAGVLARKVGDLSRAFTGLAGSSAAAGATGTAAGVGGAASRSALLLKNLQALAKLGVIAIAIQLVVDGEQLDRLVGWLEDRTGNKGIFTYGLGDLMRDVGSAGRADSDIVRRVGSPIGADWAPSGKGPLRPGDTGADKSAASSKGAHLSAKYGGLQPGATSLAGFVEASGGTISAGREGGHSPTGGHGAGESLDISWARNGPKIWAALFPHRAKFRLLLGPPGLYMWGERYYNEKDRKNHLDHIHVQYQGSAESLRKLLGDSAPDITGADPKPGQDPTGDLDLSGDIAVADKAGAKAKKISYAAEEDVKEVASKVRFAYSRLDEIPADASKRLKPALAELARILGKPVTPETLKEVERQAEMYMRQVGRILEADKVAAKWKGQRAKLEKLLELDVFPPAREAQLRKQIARMDVAVAAAQKSVVPTPAQIAAIKRGQAQIAEAIEEGIELAREAIESAKDKFESAWGRFTDLALAAFDAETDRLLARMRVKVRSVVDGVAKEWEFGPGFKTPSEQILEAEESARAKAAHEETMRLARERVAAANAAVLAAQAEGGETLEQALAEQGAANQALEELLWQERRMMLVAAAAEERTIAEGRLTQAQSLEQARRNVLRGEFQAELAELGIQIATRGLTYNEAMTELQKLFAKYEVPFEEQGAALSSALGIGLMSALSEVEEAVGKLIDAVDRLNRALGQGVREAGGHVAEMKRLYGEANYVVPTPSPGGGGGGIAKPMAEGAEVARRTLAWIGEAGREWVVPEGKIPPHLRPVLVPMLRRIIRGGAGRPERGLGGILELAGGGLFGGGPVYNEAAAMQRDRSWAVMREFGGNLYESRDLALSRRGGGLGYGTPEGAGAAGGLLGRGLHQEVNMHFTHQPADPWVYFDKARLLSLASRG